MIYDCIIPFLLLYKRTRYFAFFMVIAFHIMTRILFPPIGMFPYIMIFSCIIFFDSGLHKKILDFIRSIFRLKITNDEKFNSDPKTYLRNRLIIPILSLFFIIQIIFPLRSTLYPGELFWTEQGYRFSWRVMLIEKAGYTTFKVVDNSSNKFQVIDNMEFLTPFQEKQMSFQPDMILEYAHYLGDYKSPDTMLQDFEYQIQICSIERNMDYCLMKKFSTDLDFQNYRKQLDIYLVRIIFSPLRLKLLLATHCQILSGYYHSQT